MAGGWWNHRCHRCHGKNGGKMTSLFLLWVRKESLKLLHFGGLKQYKDSGNVEGFPFLTMHCFGLFSFVTPVLVQNERHRNCRS